MKGVGLRVEVPELNQAQFPQLGDARVGRLRLEEQLAQGHLLAAKEGASLLHHGRAAALPTVTVAIST